MAAVVSVDQKKKSSRHRHRDGASGMSSATKRHFDHVKRKLLAFVDRQQTWEVDGQHLAPPPGFHHRHPPPPPPPPPPPMFADHKKIPRQPLHHGAPVPAHKQFLTPAPPRRQLPPHLVLATPQVARRIGK